MKIEALKNIIEFDGGQMIVINAGETGDLSDAKAQALIEAGEVIPVDGSVFAQVVDADGAPLAVPDAESVDPVALDITDAERADLPQLDHDGDGTAGGSTSGGSGEDMKALRAEYARVVGKNAFPSWDADELHRRMAAHQATESVGDDGADAPPA